MELDLGPELTAFRQEMRDWIAANAPKGLADLVDWNIPSIGGSNRDPIFEAMADPLYKEWDRKLTEAKLTCAHWPENVGGRGWDAVRSAIFNEELHRARLPRNDRGMGEWLVGPSVIAHGTEEQKEKYLPPIISGEHKYCQGFSEPNHGSDLGAVETRGVVDGDEIVITGQKVWTSGAMRANRIFILCRTDPEAPKHRGLSFVLCDFIDNNIEARPLKQMSGAAEFCEDFIDGARAPIDGVIGGLNNGWKVAMTTLGYERGGRATTQYLGYEREFWELLETARKYGKDKDPLVRQKLAWAYTHVQIMKYQGLRVLTQAAKGKQPGPEASTSKLFWSEYHKKLGELAVAIEGADALVRPDGDGYETTPWQGTFLASRAGTIYSGTSEIQRNIVSERALGLPRR